MSILLYGGGFDPPHLGHLAAADRAYQALRPDRFLVIPDGTPPHKPLPKEAPDALTRLELCQIAFRDRPWADVLDLAATREGPCYMIDTVEIVEDRYPGEQIWLLVGTDMLRCLDRWYRAEELFRHCVIVALSRDTDERHLLDRKAQELRSAFGAKIQILEHEALPLSSSQIRAALPLRKGREGLTEETYRRVIRGRLYGAKAELRWLQEQVDAMLDPGRVAHVHGCAATARELALRWDLDPDAAQEAGILHDCTKAWTDEQQLRYCDEMGIELDPMERKSPQLLHARTGAVAAAQLFGAPEEICDAIRWHTTGKPDMDRFEKILYLADMIEPGRTFNGVDAIRALADRDLDAAMAEALRVSVQSIRRRKMHLYKDTQEAYDWYSSRVREIKEEILC